MISVADAAAGGKGKDGRGTGKDDKGKDSRAGGNSKGDSTDRGGDKGDNKEKDIAVVFERVRPRHTGTWRDTDNPNNRDTRKKIPDRKQSNRIRFRSRWLQLRFSFEWFLFSLFLFSFDFPPHLR